MMEEEEYASDTDDEDYVPTDGEAVSEEEGSGEEETLPDDAATDQTSKQKIKRKRSKKKTDSEPRKRRGGIKLDEENTEDDPPVEDDYNKQLDEQVKIEKQEKQESCEKKRADDLWANFMNDVGPKSKPAPKSSAGLGSLTSITKSSSSKPVATVTNGTKAPTNFTKAQSSDTGKVTVTQEFDFAGEVVKVTKEVDAHSKEAKAELKKQQDSEPNATAGPSLAGLNKPGGGLGSLLGKIGKKQKISTLEKSKLDWNNFKTKEGISDELEIHNRGKGSFLERQAFLERADYRQFEIERNMRLSNSKR